MTKEGNLRALAAHEVEMVDGSFEKVVGSDFELEADMVFLAMGFTEQKFASTATRS